MMRTAERAYCDDVEQRYLFARCSVPYLQLAQRGEWVGRRVLDAGSGSGAGAAILARAGATVYAVDFSAEDVILTMHGCGAVRGLVADVTALPLADDSFDLAVSCHVLEHLAAPEQYLRELRRVLRPGASIWIITPNRLFSSPNGPPPNPFHLKEYFHDEFVALVHSIFPGATFRGVNHAAGGSVARAHQANARLHTLDVLRLRRLVPQPLKKLVRTLVGAGYPTELKRVDSDDFRIEPIDPAVAVDLVAVAVKDQ
jgi:SAM-dependent methyltransferase